VLLLPCLFTICLLCTRCSRNMATRKAPLMALYYYHHTRWNAGREGGRACGRRNQTWWAAYFFETGGRRGINWTLSVFCYRISQRRRAKNGRRETRSATARAGAWRRGYGMAAV